MGTAGFRSAALAAALAVAGCHHGGAKTVAPLALTETTWQLATVDGQNADNLAGGHPATLRLGTNRTVSGFTGCNRFRSSYTLAGDSIGFGPIIVRHRACAGPPELESAYLSALRSTRRFAFKGDSLELLASGAPVAVFVRY
jgi:putative lipoprotein